MASVAAMALALTQTIQAVPVTGNIGITGQVTLDTSSAATATEVTSWINTAVNGASGTFLAIPNNTPVQFPNATWKFNTASTINPFWTITSYGCTFSLTSSSILFQGGTPGINGFVDVNGWGTISGNGYTPTQMFWTFSISDPPANGNSPTWTFRASANSVPDGGATVMLLGIALSGVALLKKKLMA